MFSIFMYITENKVAIPSKRKLTLQQRRLWVNGKKKKKKQESCIYSVYGYVSSSSLLYSRLPSQDNKNMYLVALLINIQNIQCMHGGVFYKKEKKESK